MTDNDIGNIRIILGQFGGPISINADLRNRAYISNDIIAYHREKLRENNGYNSSDYFSLFYIVRFVLDDLGEEEFNLVTGMDLYKEGYPLLNKLKKSI